MFTPCRMPPPPHSTTPTTVTCVYRLQLGSRAPIWVCCWIGNLFESIPTYGVMWWWAAAYSDLRNKQHIQRSTGGRARDGHSIRICFPRCACCLLLVLWNRYQFHICVLYDRVQVHISLDAPLSFPLCVTPSQTHIPSLGWTNEYGGVVLLLQSELGQVGRPAPNQFLVTIMKVLRFVLP